MNYLDWNDAIAGSFFKPEHAGRRVHLYVTSDLIEELGSKSGEGVADFVRCIKKGLGFAQNLSLFEGAYQWAQRWRGLAPPQMMGLEYPPYIGHLALCVLAAGYGERGEFNASAYYPRLRTLLGEGSSAGHYPHFEKLDDVWGDLQLWSVEDCRGELGMFEVHYAGRWNHVGIPLFQTLLAERERKALTNIFARAGMQPAVPPSEQELAAHVVSRSEGFRTRTISLLNKNQDSDRVYRDALIEAMLEELEQWDGSVVHYDTEERVTTETNASLVLGLTLTPFDDVEGIRLYCTSTRDFPSEGLELDLPEGLSGFCEELLDGWSTPVELDDRTLFSPGLLDWASGVTISAVGQPWVLRMPPASVRLFVNGSDRGLPGFVESRQIPLGQPFFVALNRNVDKGVMEWLQAHCGSLVKLEANQLPEGWLLFSASAVTDSVVKEEMPPSLTSLAPTTSTKLSLYGGIRSSRADEFFSFATPLIRVQAATPVDVWCNGSCIAQGVREESLEIPNEATASQIIRIELRRDDQVLRSRQLFILDQFTPSSPGDLCFFDRFGAPTTQANGIAGALVATGSKSSRCFNALPELPSFGRRTAYLVGQEPGQIVKWPQDPLPTKWQSIWAVPMDKKGQAVYCGPQLPVPPPLVESDSYPAKARKKWREVLWVKRKAVDPPENRDIRSSWYEYRDAAKRVR